MFNQFFNYSNGISYSLLSHSSDENMAVNIYYTDFTLQLSWLNIELRLLCHGWLNSVFIYCCREFIYTVSAWIFWILLLGVIAFIYEGEAVFCHESGQVVL